MSEKAKIVKAPKTKKPFRIRFLTIVMVYVILFTGVINGMCLYDLFGKDTILPLSATTLTPEEIALEEERQMIETQEGLRRASGNICYIPSTEEGERLDIVIEDEYDAKEVLTALQNELGISDVSEEYYYAYTTSDAFSDVYTMQQYYNDTIVYGSEIQVTADKDGELVSITGSYVDVEEVLSEEEEEPAADDDDEDEDDEEEDKEDEAEKEEEKREEAQEFITDTELDEDEAYEIVEKLIKDKYKMDSDEADIRSYGKRVCLLNNAQMYVSYLFEVAEDYYDNAFLRVFIDAHTGDILSSQELFTPGIADAEPTNENPPANEEVTLGDIQDSMDTNYGRDITYLYDEERGLAIYDAAGKDIQSLDDCTLIEWETETEKPDASAVNVMGNLQKVYDYYLNVLGREGIGNASGSFLPAAMHVGSYHGVALDNSVRMVDTPIMLFGETTDAQGYAYYLDAIAREFTYGIIADESSLLDNVSSNQTNSAQFAISVGLADLFGELVEAYYNNGSCDWIVANGVRNLAGKSGSSGYLTDVTQYEEGVTNGYSASGIISYTAYLMAQGIDGNADKALSLESLSCLYYSVIPKLSSTTDFADFRSIVEAQAHEMRINGMYGDLGLTDAQFECVMDAFDMAGIENRWQYHMTPDATFDIYDSSNQGCTEYNLVITHMGLVTPLVDEDVDTQFFSLQNQLVPGIYEAILTDEDGGITETFTFVVNDNAPGQLTEAYQSSAKIFTSFGSPEREVVLVLDVSGSMEGTPLDETKKAATTFVHDVFEANPNAKISIVTYDYYANVIAESSSDEMFLYEQINGLYTSGTTNMHDGMTKAFDILKDAEAEKKTMIVMSDGAPCEGENDNGDYYAPIVELAEDIKKEDIMIYTLGFFHSISDGEVKDECVALMEQIATKGYAYNIQDSDEVVFVFDEFVKQISDEHYIQIRIACPVDVTVRCDGEVLSSAKRDRNTRTEFGSLYFEGDDDEVKVLRLSQDADYEICITGTGKGEMDYEISYPDEDGDYVDVRSFDNVPITRDTVIATNTKPTEITKLNVDSDGDGIFDINYIAEEDSAGEQVVDNTPRTLAIITGVFFALLVILEIVLLIKDFRSRPRKPKTPKLHNCPQCGVRLEADAKFCGKCGKVLESEPKPAAEMPTSINCPTCNAELPVKAKFCNKCGTVMPALAPVAPAPAPEPAPKKKQSKAVWITKLAVMGVCILLTFGVVSMYRSAATTIYKQIQNQELQSAELLYEDNVKDSWMSKKYLSALTNRYLKKVHTACEEETANPAGAAEIYAVVSDMKIGAASDTAKKFLKEYEKSIDGEAEEQETEEEAAKEEEKE